MSRYEIKYLSPLVEVRILDPRIGQEWDIGYQTPGAAAIDLIACLDGRQPILPGETILIPSGIAIHIADPGYAALILPRSGLGMRGLVIGNLVGLIDSDYQGQVMIAAWNRNPTAPIEALRPIEVKPGDRLAQMIFVPILRPAFRIVEKFSQHSERADGGFGSTGIQTERRK